MIKRSLALAYCASMMRRSCASCAARCTELSCVDALRHSSSQPEDPCRKRLDRDFLAISYISMDRRYPRSVEAYQSSQASQPGLIHVVQVTIFLALLLSCLHELVSLWLC